jgi:hypothetical protein
MKKIIFVLAAIFVFNYAFSQDDEKEVKLEDDGIKTLLGTDHKVGGYAALNFHYTEIDGRQGMSVGAKGAVLIGHSFAIGLGGSGFFNDVTIDKETGLYNNLEGGYGGIFFEPIILPKLPVHISIPILIGVGGVAYVNDYYYSYDDWGYVEDADAFVIVEPGIELEANLLKFMRISLGATYRYTSDILINNKSKDILNGLSAGMSLKFGSF